MKNNLNLFVLLVSALCFQSCRNCTKDGYLPYVATDPRIVSCFFQVGSYFIYYDSTDNIIDSQYVNSYYYQSKSMELGGRDGCYTFGDTYVMTQRSYRNGVLYDSIQTSQIQSALVRQESAPQAPQTKPGFSPGIDTLINNFSVLGTVFPTAYKAEEALLLLEGSDTVSMTLYFSPGYGIVKRTEHRPTGDVSWDLIRYNIVH
jgi:hypothetical protein